MTASSPDLQCCAICRVEIEVSDTQQDVVHFSNGPSGTRSKLWSRVCRYLSTPDQQRICINQDPDQRGPVQLGDAFPDAPSIDLNAA